MSVKSTSCSKLFSERTIATHMQVELYTFSTAVQIIYNLELIFEDSN